MNKELRMALDQLMSTARITPDTAILAAATDAASGDTEHFVYGEQAHILQALYALILHLRVYMVGDDVDGCIREVVESALRDDITLRRISWDE